MEYLPRAERTTRSLAAAYKETTWPQISLRDWAYVMAGRLRLAYYDHRDNEVDAMWRWILDSAEYFGASAELLATINLTRSRSLKRRGLFKDALDLTEKAISQYAQGNFPFMVAVAQVNQSWLLDQLGRSTEACRIRENALEMLQGTQDWTNLGNIHFAIARTQIHAGVDRMQEACETYSRAVVFYSQAVHFHRNLRRTFLALAELHLRLARKLPSRSSELTQHAEQNISKAEKLLRSDRGDYRNWARLLLGKANLALSAPNIHSARAWAKKAYEFAEQHADDVMMARARLRQAGIERKAALEDNWETRPLLALYHALDYANKGILLAENKDNARLLVRFHTLLGDLFINEGLCRDVSMAAEHCAKAQQYLSSHEDVAHLERGVLSLQERLCSAQEKGNTAIFIVTSKCLDRALTETVEQVERAVLDAVRAGFGEKSDAMVRTVLRIGPARLNRITKVRILGDRFQIPGEEPIFRVTKGMAFAGGGLERVVQMVEIEVIRAALKEYNDDEDLVKRRLHVGYERLARIASIVKQEGQGTLSLLHLQNQAR